MVADGTQVAEEVPGGGVALSGVLRETALLDDPAQNLGHGGVNSSQRLWLVPQDDGQRVRRALPLKRATARGHLVEHRAEAELVRPEVDGLARGLLGGHIPRGSHDLARAGLHLGQRRLFTYVSRATLGQLRQPEVQNLDMALGRDD
jgi:hypothetical protein